jgi:hypothetical protein
MLSPEEKYKPISKLDQGTVFTYNGDRLLKLPPHVECYGNICNAINIKTATMIYFNDDVLVDMDTMIASKNYII